MRFAFLVPIALLASRPAIADPNEDCFKSRSMFHDLMINNSQAMLNLLEPIRSVLIRADLVEISQPATIIYVIKKYGGSEMGMAVLSALAERNRDAKFCSNLTEEECYQQELKKVRATRSDSKVDRFHSILEGLPKLAEEYMVITGSTAVDYNPHLKRTICQGSYTVNLSAFMTVVGEQISEQDLKEIGRWTGKSAQIDNRRVNGQRTYSVQPDGQGGFDSLPHQQPVASASRY